ncbi:hypothetical protein TCAL_02079 [Tigriopus californicus]|uniref:PDZ domain-containing protein n=1 Tax=Tigriopus californicus TaxID=6832 RepID=A0A553NEW2_TIGCA|nr:hypothetical protein TCAL_02079 [Tigriopus californicus]
MLSGSGSPTSILALCQSKVSPCLLMEDYVWLDRDGRPTSPPSIGKDTLESKLVAGNSSRDSSNSDGSIRSNKILATHPRRTNSFRRHNTNQVKQVDFELSPNDNLGLTIRGGKEYGLGIYITAVDENSAASDHGLRPGDEILEVNGRPFCPLTHDKAARILKFSKRLTMVVRDVGKIPHSPSSGTNSVERSSKASSSGGSASTIASMWSPKDPEAKWLPNDEREDIDHSENLNRIASFVKECKSTLNSATEMTPLDSDFEAVGTNGHTPSSSSASVFQSQRFRPLNSQATMETTLSSSRPRKSSLTIASSPRSDFCGQATRSMPRRRSIRRRSNENNQCALPVESPELAMVLEKAQVLLNRNEFSALSLLLDEYRTCGIGIEEFASGLSQIIADGEKSSFFTEIREIVRLQDLVRFDHIVYQQNNPRRFDYSPNFDSENDDEAAAIEDMAHHMMFMGRPSEEGPLVGQQNPNKPQQHLMGPVTTMCSSRTRDQVEYMSRNFGDNRPGGGEGGGNVGTGGTGRCAPLVLDENGRPLIGNRLAYGYERNVLNDDPNQDELRNNDDGDVDNDDDNGEELGKAIDLLRNTPQVALPFRESTSPHHHLETALPALKSLGYDGVEAPLKFILYFGKDKFKDLLRQHELKVIIMVFTDGPNAPGEGILFGGPYEGFTRPSQPGDTNKEDLIETHFKVFHEQVQMAQEFQPTLINSHSLKDYFTEEMAEQFFSKALAWQIEMGYTVHHETHRKRFLHSPWLSRQFVPKHSNLTMVADLSHWINVAETSADDLDLTQVIEDFAPRFRHVHCRVGYDHGPQVPDPRAPEWISYMEGHERWWDYIWEAMRQQGIEEVTMTPEHGPPNYQICHPYTQEPMGSIWDINHWVALRRQVRFAELYGLENTSDLVPSETQGLHPPTVPGQSVLKELSRLIPVFPRDQYASVDGRAYSVRIPKDWPNLGMAIEGGSNTQQPLPRIIAIQPNGAAFNVQGLRVGQLIREVDGILLAGLPHEKAAKIIAERFANKNRRHLVLVVRDQKRTPAEKRRGFMPPQH